MNFSLEFRINWNIWLNPAYTTGTCERNWQTQRLLRNYIFFHDFVILFACLFVCFGFFFCILISLIYKWVCYLLTRRKEAKVKRQQRDIVCMQRELCELTRLMHIANTQVLSLDLAIDQTKMEMASLCSQSEFCGKMFRYNIIIVYVHQQHVKAPKLYILLARET